eukprot:TRINITY_DN659_c0_g2_i1.p1 TRINITY_DN659_c0_g2~~TRINITY_DN659_c0_g2_i1.p1  ORF type:complete len:112 (+),score=5.70 TRINITY_DN659_c0_g2_i1:390-725(+)
MGVMPFSPIGYIKRSDPIIRTRTQVCRWVYRSGILAGSNTLTRSSAFELTSVHGCTFSHMGRCIKCSDPSPGFELRSVDGCTHSPTQGGSNALDSNSGLWMGVPFSHKSVE